MILCSSLGVEMSPVRSLAKVYLRIRRLVARTAVVRPLGSGNPWESMDSDCYGFPWIPWQGLLESNIRTMIRSSQLATTLTLTVFWGKFDINRNDVRSIHLWYFIDDFTSMLCLFCHFAAADEGDGEENSILSRGPLYQAYKLLQTTLRMWIAIEFNNCIIAFVSDPRPHLYW